MNSAPEAFLDADHLPETLRRLDALIDQTEDIERMRAGLGMRLALSMGLEIREGKVPGSDTADLVSDWMRRFGQDTVDQAVSVARAFLTRPGELAMELKLQISSPPQPPSPSLKGWRGGG